MIPLESLSTLWPRKRTWLLAEPICILYKWTCRGHTSTCRVYQSIVQSKWTILLNLYYRSLLAWISNKLQEDLTLDPLWPSHDTRLPGLISKVCVPAWSSAGWPCRYTNVRHCGGSSMELFKLNDLCDHSLREGGFGFLFRFDMTTNRPSIHPK